MIKHLKYQCWKLSLTLHRASYCYKQKRLAGLRLQPGCMLTFGSIIKSRMTEDFTLFDTLRKVVWSALNMMIALNPQLWHERKRDPWSWLIGTKKKKKPNVFFFFISKMITPLSYLQQGLMQLESHQNEQTIRVDWCYATVLGLNPTTSRSQHESQNQIFLLWKPALICFVFNPKHTLFKEAP